MVDIDPANQVEIRYKLRPEDEWRKGFILMRVDWENQIFELMQLRQGEWPSGKGLDVERMHAPYYGIQIGDQVIIQVDEQEKRFPVQGVIRAPFVPPPSMWDLTFFFSADEVIEQFGLPRWQIHAAQSAGAALQRHPRPAGGFRTETAPGQAGLPGGQHALPGPAGALGAYFHRRAW